MEVTKRLGMLTVHNTLFMAAPQLVSRLPKYLLARPSDSSPELLLAARKQYKHGAKHSKFDTGRWMEERATSGTAEPDMRLISSVMAANESDHERRGDAAMQKAVWLGRRCLHGSDEQIIDLQAALFHFKRAASRQGLVHRNGIEVLLPMTGNAVAMAYLAMMHVQGLAGLQIDHTQGDYWAEKAKEVLVEESLSESREDRGEAQCRLGVFHLLGLACDGDESDFKKAVDYFIQSGNIDGQAQQAFDQSSLSCPSSRSSSSDFDRVTNAVNFDDADGSLDFVDDVPGNAEAIWRLGMIKWLDHGDRNDALAYFKAAAALGFVEAEYTLGTCYDSVTSVDSSDGEMNSSFGVSMNEKLAERWYSAAAKKHHLAAMHNLAIIYMGGGHEAWSEPERKDHGLTLLRQAATSGFAASQHCWARYHESVNDSSEALVWYRKAGENGHKQSSKEWIRLQSAAVQSHIDNQIELAQHFRAKRNAVGMDKCKKEAQRLKQLLVKIKLLDDKILQHRTKVETLEDHFNFISQETNALQGGKPSLQARKHTENEAIQRANLLLSRKLLQSAPTLTQEPGVLLRRVMQPIAKSPKTQNILYDEKLRYKAETETRRTIRWLDPKSQHWPSVQDCSRGPKK